MPRSDVQSRSSCGVLGCGRKVMAEAAVVFRTPGWPPITAWIMFCDDHNAKSLVESGPAPLRPVEIPPDVDLEEDVEGDGDDSELDELLRRMSGLLDRRESSRRGFRRGES